MIEIIAALLFYGTAIILMAVFIMSIFFVISPTMRKDIINDWKRG